jgi:hypothetical protein
MIVNIFDVNLVSAYWSPSGGAGSAAPEPNSLGLAALAGIGLAARAWRTRRK